MIEQLNQEWKDLRHELSNDRIKFDEKYREHYKGHNCDTKVFAWNGNWFCKHLTQARNNKFRNKLNRVEEIISLMISTTK